MKLSMNFCIPGSYINSCIQSGFTSCYVRIHKKGGFRGWKSGIIVLFA